MGKWDRAITSSTSPFISFAVKRVCGYIVIIITIAPRHTICTALFSCMWLCHCNASCHTQTHSTFLRVIDVSNSLVTVALVPRVLYTSATLQPRVSFTQIRTGNFCLCFLLPFRLALLDTSFDLTPMGGVDPVLEHCPIANL